MSHKAKIAGPEKVTAIEKYLRGEDSLKHLARTLDLAFSSMKQWQTYNRLVQMDSLVHLRTYPIPMN